LLEENFLIKKAVTALAVGIFPC